MTDAIPDAIPDAEAAAAGTIGSWAASTTIAAACAIGALAIAFLVFFAGIGGRWSSPAGAFSVRPESMAFSRGSGQFAGGAWTLTAFDANGAAIIAFNLPALATAGYPSLVWDLEGGDGATLTLLWRNDLDPGTVHSKRLEWRQDQVRVLLRDDPHWQGRVGGVALVVQGPTASPLRIGALTFETLTPGETLQQLLREWTRFEPWQTSSINFRWGGSAAPLAWLPPATALVLCLAALGWLAFAVPRRIFFGAIPWVLLAVAWVVIDLGWLHNAVRQAHLSVTTLAGKSDDERLLAAADGRYYAFARSVRPLVEKASGRVFVFSDVGYARGRIAYHLLPANVWYDIRATQLPPSSAFRPGDLLLLYQLARVRFNAAEKRVLWVDGKTVDVEPIALAGGNAVFRVR